ncbi:hypothetical protein Ddye_024683 [Dipteronia dyeriana]|uniref:Uncharacterized protein n=1 Tax=Dipteronia dyeriana TaxID=168575 RepID=A0AAD9TVA7_9ROSI|nr:hypothetical protein Ddye_024683 [Dipteronia dyeriana]
MVELCGHATLAAAHTLFSRGLVNSNIIEFVTLSRILIAKKVPDVKAKLQNGETKDCYFIELDFHTVPTADFNAAEVSLICKALNFSSIVDMKITTTSKDIFVIPPNPKLFDLNAMCFILSLKSVTEVQPQIDEILKCPGRGIIVSGLAPLESRFDLYSRFFCPKFGINKDPICGSAHCAFAFYWSQKLG